MATLLVLFLIPLFQQPRDPTSRSKGSSCPGHTGGAAQQELQIYRPPQQYILGKDTLRLPAETLEVRISLPVRPADTLLIHPQNQ